MTRIVSGPLDEAQIEAAGAMLAAAFHDDPLQIHIFPDPRQRAQRSPAQFSALVRQGSLFGEVLAGDGMSGVSVWMPPGAQMSAEQVTRSGFRQLPSLMGNEAFERFGRVLDYLSAAHQVPGPHWYLVVIGVRPELRGRGLGRELLKPIITRADAAGVPVCLDTARPEAKAFYDKLGFRTARESVDPSSGLRFWTCVRDSAIPGAPTGPQA
jgi:ribosomal protein S18 acetylase RimI-like enzyme